MWLFSIRPFRGHDYDSSAIFNMRFSRPLWKSPFQPRERIEGRDLLSSMCIEANRHHSHLCNISKIFVTGDSGSIPGSGRSPGEGNGNSILAWRIPWTEEPSRLLFLGSQELDMTERLSAHIPLWLYHCYQQQYTAFCLKVITEVAHIIQWLENNHPRIWSKQSF